MGTYFLASFPMAIRALRGVALSFLGSFPRLFFVQAGQVAFVTADGSTGIWNDLPQIEHVIVQIVHTVFGGCQGRSDTWMLGAV